MKNIISGFGHKLTSVAVLLCLLLSIFAPTVMAIEVEEGDANIAPMAEKEDFNYVSIGASNVNGYGMHGYLEEDVYEYPLLKGETNIYGYKQDTPGSYPVIIQNKLSSKYNVNLSQLAMSSMRAEEVRFLLDDSYKGDAYTDWRFCDVEGYDKRNSENWFYLAGRLEWFAQGNQVEPTQEQAVEALKVAYREAIKDADLITVDIGVNNFGVYASNQIVSNMYENDLTKLDSEIAAKYEEGKAYVLELLQEVAGDKLSAMSPESIDHMADSMAYTFVGFCLSFDAVMEQIYTLNPDATVVVVSIQNLMHGFKAALPGVEEELPFGELFGALVNAANAYTSVISPYATKYYYADVSENGHVEFFMDEILRYNGDPATLSQDVKDCFDVYDDMLYIKSRVQQILATELYNAGLLDISKAVAMGGDIANNLEHFAIAYQNGLLTIPALSGITLEEYLAIGAKGELPEGVARNYYNTYVHVLTTAYDVVAEIMQNGIAVDTLDASAFGQNFGLVEDVIFEAIFIIFEGAADEAMNNPEYSFALSDVSVDFFAEIVEYINYKCEQDSDFKAEYTAKYGDFVITPEFVKTVATMGIRTGIGSSFFGHPNGAGQVELADAILEVYANGVIGEEVEKNHELVAIKDVYCYLDGNNYVETKQLLDIAVYAMTNETIDTVSYVYDNLLLNEDLTDSDRIDIIGNVYALLKGDFLGGGYPAFDTVGNLYFALKNHEPALINDSQAFAIVDFVYNCIIDGELDNKEIVAIIKYVYYTLFFTEKEETVEFSLCASIEDYEFPSLEELQSIGAGEKVAILSTVIEELKEGGYVTEESTFAPIVTLYENLVENETVTDDALAAVIDIAIEAVIAREEITGDNVLDIGFEIAENVANSPEIPEDAREIVAGEIYDAVTNVEIGGNAGGNGTSVIPQGIQNVIDRLYVRSLITRTQVLQITAKLRPLLSGDVDVATAMDVAKDVANIVFGREGITTQDKILIVLNLYTALKNEGYITDEQLVQYVEDYYLVALGLAVVYAYEQGYVDIAIDSLYDVADAIEAAKAEVANSNIDAALKEAVIAELDAAVATIINVAETANNPTFESKRDLLLWLRDLKEDVYAHLNNAQAILNLVGNNALDAAYDLWENDVKPELDILVSDIEENGLEYFAEALKEYAPIIGEAAWEALLGTPAAIKAFIEFTTTYGAYVVDFFEEYGAEFVTVFGYIAVEYGVDTLAVLINQGEEVLESLKVLVDKLGNEAWETIRLYADALDLEAKAQIEVALVIATVQNQIVTLEGYLATLEGQLVNIEAALKDAVDEAQDALYRQLDEVNNEINRVESLIAKLQLEAEKLLEEAEEIANRIKEIASAIEDLANAIMSGANDAILDAFERVYKALGELADMIEGAESLLNKLAEIANSMVDIAESLANAFDNLAENLYDLANALKIFADATIYEIAEKLSGFAADLAYNAAYITEKLGEAAEKLGNAVEKAHEAVIAFTEHIESLYYHALHGDYTFDRGNSHYVAIGDAFAADGALSYVDVLAELLTMNENHYTDLTRGAFGFTEEEALAFIEENRDIIASSDLITFGYNNISVFNAIISILGNAANLESQEINADINWAALFGEKAAETITTAIDNIEDVISEELVKALGDEIQSIKTEKLVSLASEIVEIYVYAYISRMVTIRNVIEELRATSPEALIVIVGAFNDFEGLIFDSEEFGLEQKFTFELGEYVGFVVDALNASAFVSALFDENTIFVSTEGVEKEIDTVLDGDVTVMDYLDVLYAPDLLLPSQAGNADIASRILAALNVSFAEHEHVYDNRCDDTCNTCGDVRYAGHTYANPCDDTCNICGYVRDDAADHVYDADCDAVCNVCGGTRIAVAHTFGSWKTDREPTYNVMGRKVRSCTKCGYSEYEYISVLVAEKAENGGASAGVIVAITIPSVLALAAAGFSAFWFGYKKKSFKDLAKVLEKALAVFKK